MKKIKINMLAKQAMKEKEMQQQKGGMNKYKYLLFLFAMLIVGPVNAQFGNHYRRNDLKKVVDTCVYRVTYKFAFISDDIKKSKATDKENLDIGKNMSRYYSVYANMRDSAYYKHLNRKRGENKDGSDGINPEKEAGLLPDQIALYEDIYTNYPAYDSISVFTGIYYKEYMYSESIPLFHWQITSDTTTIIGYKCMKATTTFRGREYIAWFAPFLPIKKGPWKFNGLPGLILKVSDTKGYFDWTAIGIEKPQNGTITFYGYNKETDRLTVTRMLHKRWQDPLGLLSASISPGQSLAIFDKEKGLSYKVSADGVEPADGFSYPYIPIPELDLINHEK